MSVVPTTTIPEAAAAPTLDGTESAGEYSGPALDVGKRWEGGDCASRRHDCGTAGTVGDPATSTYAKITQHDDALYLFINVRDEYQSYAVKPAECVAHWLADSVEILIDPRGNSMENLLETATTFKLGVFPFTDDPSNFNGNGANGPCWSRDADNHQGYSTGPLAATVAGRPERPRRPGRLVGDVGRHERDDHRPQLRRRPLRARGQDPAGGLCRRPSTRT